MTMNRQAMRGFEMFVEKRLIEGALDIYIARHTPDGTDVVEPIPPLVIKRHDPGVATYYSEPSLSLTNELGISFMTQMWKHGFRPVGVVDDSERVRLMEEHIKDLRRQLEVKDSQMATQMTVIRELNSIISERPQP